MAGQHVHCLKCKSTTTSKPQGSGWMTLVLLLFYIAPGIIYEFWRHTGLGKCAHCGSNDLIPAEEMKTTQRSSLPDPFPPSPPFTENVRQVNCPDCREYIRFDARKCKHCGSYINNDQNPT